MGYYDNYLKRVNRYGNTLQERIQGKREHDFEVFMKKSPNQVDAWNDLVEGEPYNAILQTKEYDQDEVVDYLLVPLENEIPMGTIIYTKDTRHKQVIYEGKTYSARRWINYAIDPYTSAGYNRYTVVELESELSWVDEGIKYTAFAHATGGGSGARDKNINLKFRMQFSEAGVYLPNKRYSIVMPTHPNIKKNMKVTLGEETWRVTGFDNISVKGVSYVTLEETLTDEKEDIPVANANQLKNWTVTTNMGDNFAVERGSTNEIKLFFFYNNIPREVSYQIIDGDTYTTFSDGEILYLKAKQTEGKTSLKVRVEGWEEEFLEIPFFISSVAHSYLKKIGPKAVYVGESANYTVRQADKNCYDMVTLQNDTAIIVQKDFSPETAELNLSIKGLKIGQNKILVGDYSFAFEVRSMWLGGDD